ncbi:MAG: ATP-dependent 6-phosphofructokinase [Chloroflexi bacterium CFX6]|nr:ATP-dependent 6-phosphofructokinase [Chloroflexi bacterium CFX6]
MPHVRRHKGTIGILTGGGDVPGLNPAIRAVTIRAIEEGYRVVGIRRGWAGLIDLVPDKDAPNHRNVQTLTRETVEGIVRTGGTFLHTARTAPSHVARDDVPPHLRDRYRDDVNDITADVLVNLDFLGIDHLIPIGGDGTLAYAVRLHREGVNVTAIPKTMDNDVPGTEYCIGFSTCVTAIINMTDALRTTAASHERLLVVEVFGRYAGFTALLPTMAGAANRCVIPEHKFDIDRLCGLLVEDQRRNPGHFAVVLASEGAAMAGDEMTFASAETDVFGHRKLGGIGEKVGAGLRAASVRHNAGKRLDVIVQRLGYLVRCGDPDAMDSIVPMVYGNLALDLVLDGTPGRMVCLRDGNYDHVPVDVVATSPKKVVDVERYYHTDRLRPRYERLHHRPLFIMTSDEGGRP